MIIAIQPLPLPLLSLRAALIVCGCALGAGLVLLLWGKLVGRAFWALAGAGAGYFCGQAIAAPLEVDPRIGQAVGAGVLALVGLVGARVLWALLAAAVISAAATVVVTVKTLPSLVETVPTLESSGDRPLEYATKFWQYVLNCLQPLWENKSTLLLTVWAVAAGLPLVIALLRPRLTAIVMTSLLGAIGLVLGAAIGCVLAAPSIEPSLWEYWYVPGCVAAGLWLLGVALQYRRALAAAKLRQGGAESEGRK
jgi:hypothetical protein